MSILGEISKAIEKASQEIGDAAKNIGNAAQDAIDNIDTERKRGKTTQKDKEQGIKSETKTQNTNLCPQCGAPLSIKVGQRLNYCQYCGAQITVDDGVERTENIDRAKIREQERLERVQLETLKLRERESIRSDRVLIILFGIIFLMGILFVLMDSCSSHKEKTQSQEGEIKTVQSSDYYEGKNYKEVVNAFEGLGFTNVSTIEIDDLVTGWVTKNGEVESVSISGDDSFSSGDWYPVDSKVVVSYHTFPEKDSSKNTEADEVNNNPTNSSTKKENNVASEEIKDQIENIKEDASVVTDSFSGLFDSVSIENSGFPDDATASQKEAITDARQYISNSSFSKNGLIHQLSSEYGSGFSEDDASFAVEYLEKNREIDWNEQAIGSAEDYLEYQAFSRNGLVKQLSSEAGSQYTKEQAEYAVSYLEKNGKVDWNEQAVKSAEEYLAFSSFSRSGLIEQLTSEYGSEFTKEQAEYAVDKVGL